MRYLETEIAETLYRTYRVPDMKTSTRGHSSFIHIPGVEIEIYNNPYRELSITINSVILKSDDPLQSIMSELDKIGLDRYPARILETVLSLKRHTDKVTFRKAIRGGEEWGISILEREYPDVRTHWEMALVDDEYCAILIDALSDLPLIFPRISVPLDGGTYTPFGSMFE